MRSMSPKESNKKRNSPTILIGGMPILAVLRTAKRITDRYFDKHPEKIKEIQSNFR